ncbi:hypothetical protein AABK37_40320, partial [Hassallia sp. VBCCA 56010]
MWGTISFYYLLPIPNAQFAMPNAQLPMSENLWLALEIGNSRLHWALFAGEKLCQVWDSVYLRAETVEQLAQKATLGNLVSIISSEGRGGGRGRGGGGGGRLCGCSS